MSLILVCDNLISFMVVEIAKEVPQTKSVARTIPAPAKCVSSLGGNEVGWSEKNRS